MRSSGLASRGGLLAACRRHPDLVLGGGIALIALGLRLAFFFRAPPLLQLRDSASYALPALDLLEGHGFDPELKRPPLYPLFLAAGFWFFGEDLRGPLLLQHVLGALGAGLTYCLARRLWGRPAGTLAGLVTALNGDLVFQEHSIMAEALFAILLIATLLAVANIRHPHPGRWALVSGVLLGLAALTRPSALALAPLLALAGAWLVPATLRRRLVVGGLLLVGCLGAVLPWMVRNQAVHGTFAVAGGLGEALISRTRHHDRYQSDSFGAAAYADAAAGARRETGDRLAEPRRWVYRQLARTDQADLIFLGLQREFGLSQREADGLLREIALRAIWSNLDRYLLSTARMGVELFLGWDKPLASMWETAGKPKLQQEWGARGAHLLGPPTAAQEREFQTAQALLNLYEHHRVGGLVAGLFLAGIAAALAGARYRAALPTVLTVVVLLTLSVATAGRLIRYRVAVEPLIAVVAVGGLVGLWELGRAMLRAWPIRHRPPRRSEATT